MAEAVTNIRVRQDGENIIITYDLNKRSDIRVYMTSSETNKYIELRDVEGATGRNVEAGEDLQIIWQPLKSRDIFLENGVQFKVMAVSPYFNYASSDRHSRETFILGELGYSVTPQLGYGFMFGQTYSGCGWYVKGRSNFHFRGIKPTLSCETGGSINGEMPLYSGKKESLELIIDAGFVMDILELTLKPMNRFHTFGFYTGMGYGKRELYWEQVDGQWVKYAPSSYNGFSFDIGLIGSIYGLTLTAGINTINFKYLELEVGIGWMF